MCQGVHKGSLICFQKNKFKVATGKIRSNEKLAKKSCFLRKSGFRQSQGCCLENSHGRRSVSTIRVLLPVSGCCFSTWHQLFTSRILFILWLILYFCWLGVIHKWRHGLRSQESFGNNTIALVIKGVTMGGGGVKIFQKCVTTPYVSLQNWWWQILFKY